jgi:hypothetical protein
VDLVARTVSSQQHHQPPHNSPKCVTGWFPSFVILLNQQPFVVFLFYPFNYESPRLATSSQSLSLQLCAILPKYIYLPLSTFCKKQKYLNSEERTKTALTINLYHSPGLTLHYMPHHTDTSIIEHPIYGPTQ